jgi:hypothetical protein
MIFTYRSKKIDVLQFAAWMPAALAALSASAMKSLGNPLRMKAGLRLPQA